MGNVFRGRRQIGGGGGGGETTFCDVTHRLSWIFRSFRKDIKIHKPYMEILRRVECFSETGGWRCVPAGSEKKGKERLKKMIEKKKKERKNGGKTFFFFSSFCLTCQSSQRGRCQEIDDVIGFSWGCFGLHGEFVVFLRLFVINFERTFLISFFFFFFRGQKIART